MRNRIIVFWVLILNLSLCACGQRTPTWQDQYDLGTRYLSDGNYENAIIAFTAAIEIDPQNVNAYIGRADTYVKRGSAEDLLLAKEDYDRAIGLESELLEAYQKQSIVLTMMGDYVEGLATL